MDEECLKEISFCDPMLIMIHYLQIFINKSEVLFNLKTLLPGYLDHEGLCFNRHHVDVSRGVWKPQWGR